MQNTPVSLAIAKLTLSTDWEVKDDSDPLTLCWHDEKKQQPSLEDIEQMRQAMAAEAVAVAYMAQRAAEYPPTTDYLDGVVKGDQAQIDAYIAACQAVKLKYPKPE